MTDSTSAIMKGQQAGQESAKKSRGQHTGWLRKTLSALPLLAIVVAGLFLWKGYSEETIDITNNTGRAATPAVTNTEIRNATWSKNQGEYLPVNEWSDPEKLLPGDCPVVFANGYGIVYVAQYQLYSDTWVDVVAGTSPVMSDYRFKVLVHGITELPVRKVCS